jgi:hypothetical protein
LLWDEFPSDAAFPKAFDPKCQPGLAEPRVALRRLPLNSQPATLNHAMGLKKHPLRLLIMGRHNIARRWQKSKGHQQPANGRRGSGRRESASIGTIRG